MSRLKQTYPSTMFFFWFPEKMYHLCTLYHALPLYPQVDAGKDSPVSNPLMLLTSKVQVHHVICTAEVVMLWQSLL